MQIRINLVSLFLLFSTFLGTSSFGQQPIQQIDPEVTWSTAIDLWNKEKYAAAQKYFIEAEKFYVNTNSPRWTDCQFYSAYCALKLYNKDAEFRFQRFLELHPEDPRDNLVYFLLGKYHFERKNYDNTLEWFSKIDLKGIPEENISDYYYYKGFSLFKTDQFKEAQLSLSHNLVENDPYYYPALYYTAFIDYSDKHYEIALERFLLLADQEGFSELIPYYIAQIYFLQERYQDLISYAEPWMDQVDTKRKSEMSRLLAEAYYYEGDYKKSLEYFTLYFSFSGNISRDDFYAYGYSLYKTGDYEAAIIQFNRMINKDDELTQIALLNMGDCYLKLEKFKNAQNAFKNASDLDYNADIKEEAFFNYAKLSYQLSFDPYDEAIQAFEKYLDSYPNSDKKAEAYIFLLNVYMKTRNYQSALAVIDKIPNPDYKVKSAYQLAVYNIAVDYFQQKNYDEAIRWFQNVAKYDFEKITLAESYFWLGELNFKTKNYRGAIDSYTRFLTATQAYQSEYFSRGYYGQAYAQLKLKAYDKALENYQQFIHFDKGKNVKLNADAEQRIGDLYFLRKNYEKSISYFTTAISKSDFDKDYALYQIAMAQGYMDQNEAKIKSLFRLIAEVPESVYKPQALFEIGSTYFDMENYSSALEVLADLEENYPNSNLIADSYLKRGLIYLKQHNNDASRDAFLYVFENYPNSKASNEALISLKEVDLATFTRLAKETGYANISEDDVDAANFEEAEESYLNGKYERSAFLLGHYLAGFPNGRFRQNAHYYKADCHVRMEENDSALVQFEYLLEQPGNPYYENALYMSANLANRLNDTEKMYQYYQLLYSSSGNKQYQSEALNYIIEIAYEKEEYLKVIQWAEVLRKDDKRQDTERQSALLYEINSYLKLDDREMAYQLIKEANYNLRDENTAEISYKKAQMLYDQAKYSEAETALYFLLQNFASYGEWRARGFILLGDVYVGLDDPFQAKATWKSVIDHHKGADLVAIAQQKLDNLIQQEEDANKVEEEEIEVDFIKTDPELTPNLPDSAMEDDGQLNDIEIIRTDSINEKDE